MSKALTTEEYIKKAKLKHGDKNDYSQTIYINYYTKIKIRCIKHNWIFEQNPNNHLFGSGCPRCGNNAPLTTDYFIQKSNIKHNNKYNYSKTKCINSYTKVKIICNIHGVFEQNPRDHLKGAGCPKCPRDRFRRTKEQFIEKSILIHGHKYDYSLVEYINCKTKVKIICPKHGIFEQCPKEHTRGVGCQKCAIEGNRLSQEQFIEKSNITHNNKYIYSLVKFIDTLTIVKIICPKHGVFEQRPRDHLCGVVCPKCSKHYSKGEDQIEKYLKEHNINYIKQHKYKDCRNKLPLPFDFYLPDHNICIEFDGMYHYEPVKGLDKLLEIQKHDNIKTKYCENNNIKLIRIPYWDDGKIDKILSIMIFFRVNIIPRQ